MAKFIAKFTNFLEEVKGAPSGKPWQVYIEGLSYCIGKGESIYMMANGGKEMFYVVKLEFKTTNNKAKYEVVLTGSTIPEALRARKVDVKVDSQIVVNQITR